MSINITRTKIRLPRRRSDLLSRPRLNSILSDLLDYRFTLISAPAGYGKTSLMIDLAHRASHPVCWYSIDRLDCNPKRFLAHFIHAIKVEFPAFGTSSLDILANLHDPLGTPDQFVSVLIQEIYQTISENFVIFIDDFHYLTDQQEINRFISYFGKMMDENTHLVISSRNLFGFPDLSLLIGRKQIIGVNQEDLAFQPYELQDYFQEKLNISLSDKESYDMIEGTAGWITGLLLKKYDLPSLLPSQNKAKSVTGADLDSYFNDQVFNKQPSPMVNMMLWTSVLDEFNTDFCVEIFGATKNISWQEFIDYLTNHNIFVELIEDNGVWIRYHDLFREFLNRKLSINFPLKRDKILRNLVQIHIKYDNWELAYDVAVKLADAREIAKIVELSYGSLFHFGRIKLLAKWLDQLSHEGYLSRPILYSLKGFTTTELGNPSLGFSEIERALKNDQIKDNKKLLAKSLIWKSTANRLLGKYQEGINDSKYSISTIADLKDTHDIEAEAHREIGLGYGRLGIDYLALKHLKKSLEQYKKCKRDNNVAQVQVDIGHSYLSCGNFIKAEYYFKESLPHWQFKGNNVQLSNLMNNLGYLSILLGRYSEASNWLENGEEYAKKSSSKRMQAFIAASRGDLARFLELYDIGLNYYEKAQLLSLNNPDPFLVYYIPISRASCHRCLGNPAEGKNILIDLQETISYEFGNYELGLWFLEWGFLNLESNDLVVAKESFKYANQIFSGMNRSYDKAKSILGLCLVSNSCAREYQIHKDVDDLENILSTLESYRPLLPEFSHHLVSIRKIKNPQNKQLNIIKCLKEVDHFHKSLQNNQAKLYPAPDIGPDIPYLEIQGFGDINVRLYGERITASEWIHQRTVRELFYYLLTQAKGVTKDQVGLAFWPESSPSQLSCQFKNAIYRLRRALGSDCINYQQENRKYSSNRDIDYSYDVEDFQGLHQLALSQQDDIARAELLRQASALYQHPFGLQLEGIWVEPFRRNLYLIYEDIMLSLCEYDLQTGNFDSCRDNCLKLLEIESCQEQAYQFCMKAQFGLNDLTSIHRTYIRCQENFQNILGIHPSKITSSLYKDLISK